MTTPAKARERLFLVIAALSGIAAFVALFASGLRAMVLTLAIGIVIYSVFALAGLWRHHWRGLRWLLALVGGAALLAAGVLWPDHLPDVPTDHSSTTGSSVATTSAAPPPAGMIFDSQVNILPGKGVDLDTGQVVTSDLIESETDLYLPRNGADVFPSLSNDKVYPVLGPTEPESAVHAQCAKAPETINPTTTGSRAKDERFCFVTSDGRTAWYWVKGVDANTHQVIFHIRVWR